MRERAISPQARTKNPPPKRIFGSIRHLWPTCHPAARRLIAIRASVRLTPCETGRLSQIDAAKVWTGRKTTLASQRSALDGRRNTCALERGAEGPADEASVRAQRPPRACWSLDAPPRRQSSSRRTYQRPWVVLGGVRTHRSKGVGSHDGNCRHKRPSSSAPPLPLALPSSASASQVVILCS